MTLTLAAAPDLEQLKKQSKELLRTFRTKDPASIDRVLHNHPELGRTTPEAAARYPIQLADAQLVVAREYGFASWPRLKQEVQRRLLESGHVPMPHRATPLLSADIQGIPRFITGKVRDVYDLGETLLVVATDRISAFDVVLPTGIPDKGRVLTQISLFGFDQTREIVPNHMLTADIGDIAAALRRAGAQNIEDDLLAQLDGRSMLVRKCAAVPIECVVRGYLSGAAWNDYKALFAHGGEVMLHGIAVPVGLRESDRLPEPIFTPATKAQSGHDENISFAQASELVGDEIAAQLRDAALAIYDRAAEHGRGRGLIIADTKFEFGYLDGKLILIDEALTPDSSRFWDAALYKPGGPQPSFDKQFVRDYLVTLDWNKTYPGPALPEDVVEKTAAKYRDAYRRVTGRELPS